MKKGALPIVQEVGPYVYQYKHPFQCSKERSFGVLLMLLSCVHRNKRDLIDVQFLDEGNRVQYNTWQRYEFLPHLSNGTENDVVVAINPGTKKHTTDSCYCG